MSRDPDVHTRAASLSGALGAAYEASLQCNRCGFCTSVCPTYRATGDEGYSPRGRNQAFRALLEGRLDDPSDASDLFDSCLLCGACTTVCFSQVPTASLMSQAREAVARAKSPSAPRRIVPWILQRPAVVEHVLAYLLFWKRIGVSGFLNRFGLLRLIDKRLAAAERAAPPPPGPSVRVRLSSRAAPEHPRIVYFSACGPRYLRPSVGDAVARALDASGEPWVCAADGCCGLPGVSMGDRDAARLLAKQRIERLERFPSAVVVGDDSSCVSAMKDWPALFAPDDPWFARAQSASARVLDFAEWCDRAGLRPSLPRGGPVAYHDPCKARHGQGVIEEPRRVLARVPGGDTLPVPDAEQCCGGGGAFSFLQPDLSADVLSRKLDCLLSTGAHVVLTSSVSCLLQIESGLKARGRNDVRALHVAEYLFPPGDSVSTPASPAIDTRKPLC